MSPLLQMLALLAFCGFVVAAGIGIGMLAARWALNRGTPGGPALPRYFVRTWKKLDDAQLRAALGSWNETDPRWQAVWELLQREFEGELAVFSSGETEALVLARVAGRLDMLLQLRRELLTFRGKEPRE